ncbi:MAG: PaaI family thioesterase [Reyranellaceae bacterium]
MTAIRNPAPADAGRVDPAMAQFVEHVLAGSQVAKRLGIVLRSVEPQRVVMALPYSEANITVDTTVHGGVIAALIDIVGAACSASGADSSKIKGGATSSLVVNYLNAANGVDLEAEGRVIKRGRDTTVSEIAVRDPQGRLVATGTVTSRLW